MFTSPVRNPYRFRALLLLVALGIWIAAPSGFIALISLQTVFLIPTFIGIHIIVAIVIIVRSVYPYIRSSQLITSAARDQNGLTAPAFMQPNPTQALASDETLILERKTSPEVIRRLLMHNIILLVISISLLIIFFLAFGYAIGFYSNPISSQISNLATLCGELALLLIPIITIYSFGIRQTLQQSSITILADDRGILVRAPHKRRQFIPWDDMHVLIRVSGTMGDQSLARYAIAGKRHIIVIDLQSVYGMVYQAATWGFPQANLYQPDIETFRTNAERLIATIAVRGGALMRVDTRGYLAALLGFSRGWLITPKRRALSAASLLPVFGVTAQDVQRMQFAHPCWNPTPDTFQWADTYTGDYTLRERLTPGATIRESSRVAVPLLEILIGFLALPFILRLLGDNTIDPFTFFIGLSPLAIFIVAYLALTVFAAHRRLRRIHPAFSVDASGIHRKNPAQDIPWKRIRAWAVIPPTPMNTALTYAIFWDGPTFTWQEHPGSELAGHDGSEEGDPQLAFRVASNAVRAIIATRTRLPLYDLPQR
jgi:hypothetical protein